MKKQIVALVLISGLIMTSAAFADRGKGGGNYGCPHAKQYQQLDEATQDKLDAFFTENQSLTKEIAMKRAEMRALMKSENPDPQLAGKTAGELADLRFAMHEKAKAAGLDQYIGRFHMGPGYHGGNGCKGMGKGMGYSKGMGPCQNNELKEG